MKQVALVLSLLALAGTIVPAGLFFTGRVDLTDVKSWMLVSTIVWFAATPIWMDRNS
jgi:hypothetical protein